MKGTGAITFYMIMALFAVAISVILFINYINKVGGESPFHNNDSQPEDTVFFDAAPQKMTRDQIVNFLFQNGGSKLKNSGDAFYSNGRRFNIDPAFALAVAKVETSLGMGQCSENMDLLTWHGCNNFFCLVYDSKVFEEPEDSECSGTKWASFSTPDRGITAFFEYINSRYLRATPSQDTVSEIGCATGSYSRCYCESSGKACKAWADAVARNMKEIRASGTSN